MATNKGDKPAGAEEETETGSSAKDFCIICYGPKVEPVALACTHSFCKTCLQYLVIQMSQHFHNMVAEPPMRCPVCRDSFNAKLPFASAPPP